MQNSAGARDAVPRTLCLDDVVPNGTSRPSRLARVLPPSAPPPGLPRRADGLLWAPRCTPEEWTAWCRVRDGLDQSNDFFEVVQIEREEEQVFDLSGVARAEGWDESELMYFVFEFGTVKGMQYCREFYEMKARQEVGEEDLPVFDLVGVAEAEGWDQTELMFFVFECGVEDGVAFCREYYEMKKSREVRQAVYVDTGAGVGGKFLSEAGGGSGGEAAGRGGGIGPVPPGPVLSQRDQAVSALQALVGLLDPAVGAQVRGLVEGLLPPKPVSPAPATPTHAQIVAKLHKLYDTETQLIRKVDEVEGRVEKVRAKLVEEEAALAKVQNELSGVKDQITASLRDEHECRERTRKRGSDSEGMEDAVTVDEGESSEVVEKGKRRKVRRQGRFTRRGAGYGTSVNLLEVVGILLGLSKEDRGRCMRSAEIDDELSSMSGRNSGGGYC